jgi:hypothetical protein
MSCALQACSPATDMQPLGGERRLSRMFSIPKLRVSDRIPKSGYSAHPPHIQPSHELRSLLVRCRPVSRPNIRLSLWFPLFCYPLQVFQLATTHYPSSPFVDTIPGVPSFLLLCRFKLLPLPPGGDTIYNNKSTSSCTSSSSGSSNLNDLDTLLTSTALCILETGSPSFCDSIPEQISTPLIRAGILPALFNLRRHTSPCPSIVLQLGSGL